MSLLESGKLFASNFLRFHGGYQLSQSTMVSYAFLPHPSSSCKFKRRERAMLNIQHPPRVQPLDAIDLLWLLVLVQSCVLCYIEPSHELFFSDGLENWLDLDVVTRRYLSDHTQKIGLVVSQLIMTSDNKNPSFANHCVVYCDSEVFFTCTY